MSEQPRPTIPIPPLVEEIEGPISSFDRDVLTRRPYFLFVSGPVRPPFPIEGDSLEIGRRPEAQLKIDEPSVSRTQAILRQTTQGTFVLEDATSLNNTLLNGERLLKPAILREGDRLQFGATLLKFALLDATEEQRERALYAAKLEWLRGRH